MLCKCFRDPFPETSHQIFRFIHKFLRLASDLIGCFCRRFLIGCRLEFFFHQVLLRCSGCLPCISVLCSFCFSCCCPCIPSQFPAISGIRALIPKYAGPVCPRTALKLSGISPAAHCRYRIFCSFRAVIQCFCPHIFILILFRNALVDFCSRCPAPDFAASLHLQLFQSLFLCSAHFHICLSMTDLAAHGFSGRCFIFQFFPGRSGLISPGRLLRLLFLMKAICFFPFHLGLLHSCNFIRLCCHDPVQF